MLRVVSAFQIGQNVHRRWSQIWTAVFVNGRRSHWESAFCDTWKSSSNCPWIFRRSRHLQKFMPHDFDGKNEDASCCPKIRASNADRGTKTEPRHIQSGANIIDRSNTDENFLKNVITGDESWVYAYDIETKAQSLQWVGISSPRPKKARQCRSNVKVMLIVFLLEGYCSSWICSTWWDSQ